MGIIMMLALVGFFYWLGYSMGKTVQFRRDLRFLNQMEAELKKLETALEEFLI